MPRLSSGPAILDVDDAAFRRLLDRTTGGAASHFQEVATAHLTPIRDDALPLWPVHGGASKKGLQVRATLTTEGPQVGIVESEEYIYKAKFSRYTAEELESMAQAYAKQGKTPESQEKILKYWRAKLFESHGHGAPPGLELKHIWTELVRAPARAQEKALAAKLQADLAKLAGAD